MRIAEKALKLIRAKAAHYEEIGLSISAPAGRIGSGSRGTSRVEVAAIGTVDAMVDLEKQKRDYLAIIARAEKIISRMPHEKYRQILTYRYLCGWSFRSISDELGYSDPNSVYRSHGWALVEAQKIMGEMTL